MSVLPVAPTGDMNGKLSDIPFNRELRERNLQTEKGASCQTRELKYRVKPPWLTRQGSRYQAVSHFNGQFYPLVIYIMV